MREALQAYVNAQSRMLEKWAEGSLDLKNQLWRDLHACEEAGRAALNATSADAAAPSLRAVLDAVKERCLFVDDDGTVRVTDEPNIDDKLFAEICAALSSARVEG